MEQCLLTKVHHQGSLVVVVVVGGGQGKEGRGDSGDVLGLAVTAVFKIQAITICC